MRVMTSWTVDLFALMGVAIAASCYWIGVARHNASRVPWPRGRTVAFALGMLSLLIATQSGLAKFEPVFTVHVLQHIAIGMVAPVLIVAAAPVTLALRVFSPAHRRGLGHVLRHPVTRALVNPITGFALFAGSLAFVYLTPVY